MLTAIKAIMSGPYLQYMLAASIISTLASADGGTLYGMTITLPLEKDMLSPLVETWYSLFEQSPPIELLLYNPWEMRRV